MRALLLSLALAGALCAAAPGQASPSGVATTSVSAPAPVYAMQIPDKKIEITIGERGGDVRWYRNPVWMAIGGLAAVVLVLLIVLIARGGGTTIIKD